MNVRIAVLATSAMLLAPNLAISQPSDVCAKIIDHGLNNIAIATSAEAYTDRLYWRFCDQKYERLSDERKSEFALSLKSIPFNFGSNSSDSSSSEKHSKFCGDYRTQTDQRSAQAIYTNKMHDRAIDAWRACIAMTQRQLFIDFDTPTNEQLTNVTIKYTGPSGGGIMFNGVEPHEMTCTFDGKPADASTKFEISTSVKTLNCQRKSYKQEVGGVSANY